MFKELSLYDFKQVVEYVNANYWPCVHLIDPIEKLLKTKRFEGKFYGFYVDGQLMGIFYFSDKQFLCMHYTDDSCLAKFDLLKAIRLHRPLFIKGLEVKAQALMKVIIRNLSNYELAPCHIMTTENNVEYKNHLVLSEWRPACDDSLNFFIKVEVTFGRNPKSINAFRDLYKEKMAAGQYVYMEADGRVVAQGMIEYETAKFGMISGIFVDPKYRGRGYGRAITKHLTASLVEKGKIAALIVFKDNKNAIGLYESLGYKSNCDYAINRMELRR